MKNELRELLSWVCPRAVVPDLEQAIRKWAVGRVPEKRKLPDDIMDSPDYINKGHNDCREQTITCLKSQ